MSRSRSLLAALCCAALITGLWQVWLHGQQPAAPKSPGRFEFEVVHSYDAKYQGDTPGHIGRSGGLENRKLQVALGDAVMRGDEHIGRVTGLEWNRSHGSLEIEFDPVGKSRICVGDVVWVALDGKSAAAAK